MTDEQFNGLMIKCVLVFLVLFYLGTLKTKTHENAAKKAKIQPNLERKYTTLYDRPDLNKNYGYLTQDERRRHVPKIPSWLR